MALGGHKGDGPLAPTVPVTPAEACTGCVRPRGIVCKLALDRRSALRRGTAKDHTHAEPETPLRRIVQIGDFGRIGPGRCNRTGPRREVSSLRLFHRNRRFGRSCIDRPDRTIPQNAVLPCTLLSPRRPLPTPRSSWVGGLVRRPPGLTGCSPFPMIS